VHLKRWRKKAEREREMVWSDYREINGFSARMNGYCRKASVN